MKCCYCGAEISEAERFCRYCGTKQSAMPAPKPVPAPAPVPTPTPAPAPKPATVVMPAPAPDLEEPLKQPRVENEPPKNTYRPDPVPQPAPDPAPKDAPAPQPVPKAVPVPPPAPQPIPQPIPAPIPHPVNAYVPFGAHRTERPVIQLPTERAWWKMWLLGMVTFGIYPIVIWNKIVTELNIAASRYDGQRTMSYMAVCSLAPITLFIYPIVWLHNFCDRVGNELRRRDIDYKFGASTMWLWGVLGSFIIVGPFIYMHKLMKSMNLINADFNEKG